MENIIYFLVLFMFSVKINCLEGSALNLSLFEKNQIIKNKGVCKEKWCTVIGKISKRL